MMTPGARWSARIPKDIVTAAWAELVAGSPRRIAHAWQRAAACAEDPRFIDADEMGDVGPLRKVCSECPVAASCLRDALESEESRYVDAVGVRGGLTARERNRLRRLRRRARGARPPALVPAEQPSPISRNDFVATVARLAANNTNYDEALRVCGYTGRDAPFYRRLWRAHRLDLYQALRAHTPNRTEGAA